MPWISRRTIPYQNPASRNIWYFRRELKRYAKQKPTKINYNASLWKWLYSWMEYLYRYRKDQYGHIPNALLGMPLPNSRGIYDNHETFTSFVRKVSTKI